MARGFFYFFYIPGSADEPEDLLIASYRKELVRRALSRLKDEHRILLVLYYFEECTYREAAEILRIPEGTVKSRLNSAKKALKRERSDCPYDRYRGMGWFMGWINEKKAGGSCGPVATSPSSMVQ